MYPAPAGLLQSNLTSFSSPTMAMLWVSGAKAENREWPHWGGRRDLLSSWPQAWWVLTAGWCWQQISHLAHTKQKGDVSAMFKVWSCQERDRSMATMQIPRSCGGSRTGLIAITLLSLAANPGLAGGHNFNWVNELAELLCSSSNTSDLVTDPRLGQHYPKNPVTN